MVKIEDRLKSRLIESATQAIKDEALKKKYGGKPPKYTPLGTPGGGAGKLPTD